MRGRNSAPRPVLPATKAPVEWKPCRILRYLAGQRGFDWCWVHDQTLRQCADQREALAK